jgi:tRNA-Thr(GGU) m(6)t(6)A37 methyltransferase TsaA
MKIAVTGSKSRTCKGTSFVPIGRIRSEFHVPKELEFACKEGLLARTESELEIKEEFASGLQGLEEFSHAWVIYLLHGAQRVELITHPGPSSVPRLPRRGVFASRSQYRPNHLALRLVQVKRVLGNVVEVRGLDAIDGSPIIDVKPYIPHFDRPEDFRIPGWCRGWDS